MTNKQKVYIGNIFKNSRMASKKSQTDVIFDAKTTIDKISQIEQGRGFDGELVLYYIRTFFRPQDIIRIWQFDKWFDSIDVKDVENEFKGVTE